jgi:hypothetical protein
MAAEAVNRIAIDMGSQDFSLDDMKAFRNLVMMNPLLEGRPPNELITFSKDSDAYQFKNIDEMTDSQKGIPDDPNYLYYTLTWPSKGRCAVYVDPDRPTKVVLEGNNRWIERMKEGIKDTFKIGDRRYLLHTPGGIFFIWGAVLVLAIILLSAASIVLNEINPLMILVVLLTSGMLGVYLSIVKSQELQPANTISFVKKRLWWMDLIMHSITIVLGIICAILATYIVQMAID